MRYCRNNCQHQRTRDYLLQYITDRGILADITELESDGAMMIIKSTAYSQYGPESDMVKQLRTPQLFHR